MDRHYLFITDTLFQFIQGGAVSHSMAASLFLFAIFLTEKSLYPQAHSECQILVMISTPITLHFNMLRSTLRSTLGKWNHQKVLNYSYPRNG
jgi:hypothetical protein